MFKFAKIVLVVALALGLTVNSSMAGWLCRKATRTNCCPPTCCPAPVCCVADPCEVSHPCESSNCDTCGDEIEVLHETTIEETSPTPATSFDPPSGWSSSNESAVVEEAPSDLPPVPVQPVIAEEPAPLVEAAPTPLTEVAEPPVEPAAEEPVMDDLFGQEESADLPAEQPIDQPTDLPAEQPIDQPTEQPVEEPAMDDLFGEDPAEEETMDGLFGETPATEVSPMEDLPADSGPVDDLLDDEPTLLSTDDPVEGEVDDLFGDSEMEKTSEEDDIDSLFGEDPALEAETPADEMAPTDKPAPVEEEDTSFDDLFGRRGAVLGLPGGIASDRLRNWVDNTGQYKTRGRLIAVLDGGVRLLKENGRTSTVSMERLSVADGHFVNQQAAAMKNLAMYQTAQR